jgi:hypothetical protein
MRSKMKKSLAQLLRKRAEVVAEIATLQGRLQEAVTYREGAEMYSNDDFAAMRGALDNARGCLVKLKVAIDKGNHTSFDGKTVFALITQRGEVKSSLDFWAHVRNHVASRIGGEYGYDKDAPKVCARLTLREVDAELDRLKKTMRDVDDSISNINGKLEVEVDL